MDFFIRKLSSKSTQKSLRLFTLMVFIYPIFPLLLLCFWAIAVFGIYPIIEIETYTNLKIDAVINWSIMMVWLLGGLAGLLGLYKILLKKRTLISLLLISYGAISYAIVALFFIVGGIINANSFLAISHAIYLIITLCVIAVQIIITAKETIK